MHDNESIKSNLYALPPPSHYTHNNNNNKRKNNMKYNVSSMTIGADISVNISSLQGLPCL